MKHSGKTRVLLAKPGLDGHDVGAKIVARALMEAGFEVIYTGLKKSPEEIVCRAGEEGVEVLGLSVLSGSHLPICRRIKALLAENDLTDVLWIVGGNIPKMDHQGLQELGVNAVFAVGTPMQAIVDYVREKMS